MSEAKLVDFFDREYSEPPTGLDRAHMASLPFVQVAPIGADNDLLTVWYDSNEKQILAKRGCFKGTIEEFLRSAQARYGDSSTPGGTHIFYTYQNLLPTLVAQVRSLMPGGGK